MAGPFEQIRKQAREVAAGKALESGREMDMSPGYGGEYTASKYGTEPPSSAQPPPAIEALPPREPLEAPSDMVGPPAPVAPGIYGAPGDLWIYEVTGEGTAGMYRAKPPGGDWIDVSPAEQPDVHEAITTQLERGVLQPTAPEPAPELPPAESAARAALQAHNRAP